MNQRPNGLRSMALVGPRNLFGFAKSRTGVLGLTTVGSLVVRTVSSVLLTRLLRPYDFGIVGIVTSVFFVVTLVTDLGFQDFLIRHERTADRHFRDVIWTIHAKRGAALCVVVAAASPAIAWLFGKPVLALPLAVAALIFLINGAASLSLVTALRHDKSRELSILEFGLQVFQTVACLLLALWWRNLWSMIGAMLLQAGLRSVLSYTLFSDSAQRPARDRAISREFFAFSRVVLMSSAMALMIGQSDKLVLGRLFTLPEFGLYAIAVTIASAPWGFAESYINRIVFPIYALIWREAPSELPIVYYRARRATSALYALGCGGLIGSAALVVAILYDPRYAPASTFISLLMIGVAMRLPNAATTQLMVAMGHVGRTPQITLARLLWVILMIPVGFIVLGPIGVVTAMGFIEVPATLYCWVLLRRVGVLDLRKEGAFLALIAVGATIGFVGGTAILRLFPHL